LLKIAASINCEGNAATIKSGRAAALQRCLKRARPIQKKPVTPDDRKDALPEEGSIESEPELTEE
jgi:hypothetical protein